MISTWKGRKGHVLALAALLALPWGLVACDSGAQQNQKQAAGKDDDDDDDDSDDAEPVDTGGTDFVGWCAKAAETKGIQGALGDLYQNLCKGGQPTKLFKQTLVKAAYKGEDSPKISSIVKLYSDPNSKTTKWRFGVGIKLPISIQDHFNKVGPKAGDQAAQQLLITKQGATGTVAIEQQFAQDGPYHERGWMIHSTINKTVGPLTVTTETRSRSDQYKLVDGNLYLYTQHVEQGIQVVKKFDLVTAGVQIGSSGYLIAMIDLEIETKGPAEATQSQIRKTATDTIKAMYNAATEIQ
jgi:hypothetical protein